MRELTHVYDAFRTYIDRYNGIAVLGYILSSLASYQLLEDDCAV